MRKVNAFERWGQISTISSKLYSDRRMDSLTETQSESSPEGHSLSPCESLLYYLLIISKPPPCHRKSCSLIKYEHECCQLTPVLPPSSLLCFKSFWMFKRRRVGLKMSKCRFRENGHTPWTCSAVYSFMYMLQ